jgi:glutaredoxin
MNVRTFINGKLVLELDDKPEEPPTPQKNAASMTLQLTPEKVQAPVTARSLPQASEHQQKTSLQELVASRCFVAISLPNCPQCDKLATALAAHGVPVSSVFVKWEKSSPAYPALKAALAVHAGDRFTFPQVFSDGVYQGGYEEVLQKLESGFFDVLFEEQFDATPTTVQRWVDDRPVVIFSLPHCPQCDELRAMLQSRGVPTEKIFMKWDKALPEYQSLKAQLIKMIGRSQFTFPQTFVNSEYQGSFDEVSAKLEAGQFDAIFADAFGVLPLAPQASSPCEQIAFDEDF